MMLSRTASRLYWMSRYTERAENLARLLDVSYTLSLMPQSRANGSDLVAPLSITGTLDEFHRRYDTISAEAVLAFMTYDIENPDSILGCFRQARENAHAVRGKITAEMWENINATWLEAREHARNQLPYPAFFEWVKDRSHLFRGATYGTIQRNHAFSFIRLGTFLERADNTARILDVKSHLVTATFEDDAPDYYLWRSVLRSASAFEAYQEIYRDSLTAPRVAELLLLRPDVPRSLRACFDEIRPILGSLEGDNGKPAQRIAAEIQTGLEFTDINDILSEGLHAYLTRGLADINRLGAAIHHAYLEAA